MMSAKEMPGEVWERVFEFLHWRTVGGVVGMTSKPLRTLAVGYCEVGEGVRGGEVGGGGVFEVVGNIDRAIEMSVPPNIVILCVSNKFEEARAMEVYREIAKKTPKGCEILAINGPLVNSNAAATATAIKTPHTTPIHAETHPIEKIKNLMKNCSKSSTDPTDIVLTANHHGVTPDPASEVNYTDFFTNNADQKYGTHLVMGAGVDASQAEAVLGGLRGSGVPLGGVTSGKIFTKTGDLIQGVSTLSIGEQFPTGSAVAKGSKPVGGTYKIVEAEGNRVYKVEYAGEIEAVNTTMLRVLQEVGAAQAPFMLGVSSTNGDDFKLSQVYAIGQASIVLSNVVRPGQYCQFFLHDAALASADLRSRCAALPKAPATLRFQSSSTIDGGEGISCVLEIGPVIPTRCAYLPANKTLSQREPLSSKARYRTVTNDVCAPGGVGGEVEGVKDLTEMSEVQAFTSVTVTLGM